MYRLNPTRRYAPIAIALLALFISLGGTSYAAKLLIGTKQIKKNAVTTSKIRAGHVRASDIATGAVGSSELADGGVELADLSGALQAQFGVLLDGSVTTAKLANDAVTSEKVAPETLTSGDLAPESVGSSEVAANSLAAGDIASNAIQAPELANNSVDSGEVVNGGLDAVDVGRFAGSKSANLPSIPAGDCDSVVIDVTPGTPNIEGKAVVVTPDGGFSGDVSFHAETESDNLRLVACNPTAGAVNPDGAGTTYGYIVFG